MQKLTLILSSILMLLVIGCSGGTAGSGDPRKVVIQTLRAVENNDRAVLARSLDFESLLSHGGTNVTLAGDSAHEFHDPEALLDDLMEGGQTHDRWLSMQRIVGNESQEGDTAYVEVSFINKTTNTQHYNKWGLRKIDGRWKIFSFGVLSQDNQQ